MVDYRAKHWKRFGKALTHTEVGTTVEASLLLELGNLDPIEETTREEVQEQINASATVTVPQTQEIARIRKLMLMGSEPPAPAAPVAAPAESAPKEKATGEILPNVVRISNLQSEISEIEIRRLFGPENGLGCIKQLYVQKDKNNQNVDYAYVAYEKPEEAAAAIAKMNRQHFKHVVLLCDYGAEKRKERGGGGGGDVRKMQGDLRKRNKKEERKREWRKGNPKPVGEGFRNKYIPKYCWCVDAESVARRLSDKTQRVPNDHKEEGCVVFTTIQESASCMGA